MDAPLITPPAIGLRADPAPHGARINASTGELRAKAEELEGIFLNTLMSQMFNSIDARGDFGGGYAEETWRSMQAEQYANAIAKAGGVGLADQIMSNLLNAQESAQQQPQTGNTINPVASLRTYVK